MPQPPRADSDGVVSPQFKAVLLHHLEVTIREAWALRESSDPVIARAASARFQRAARQYQELARS